MNGLLTRPCRKCDGADQVSHDGSPSLCTLCARYDTLCANSRKVRANVATPELTLTRQQFIEWARTQPLVCHYCQIPERLIELLEIKTQVGHRLRRLGIDRADNDGGYDPGNLRWCCFACNKAKSNTFDETEMLVMGEAIAKVWTRRLGAAGVVWQRD